MPAHISYTDLGDPSMPVVLDGDRQCPCDPRADLCWCPTLPIRECRCYRYSLQEGMANGYPYLLDAARATSAAVVAEIRAELGLVA